MTLNGWQERLASQFSELRDVRRNRQPAHGILYALEHGLNEVEVAELRHEIHGWLKYSGPAHRHFLAWVVYSAEIGYQYSGEEYWTTFCRLTPNWQDSPNSRDHIRSAFEEFHRNFNATHPQGPWAEHFTIICWPITHAVLPKDLQRELAYVLYELRGSFTPNLLRNPELLGERIEGAAWNSGSRFRQFAENHILVGQIATALLLSEEDKDKAVILPSTLDRIAVDLDKNQRSREWLGDARRRADQIRIRGLSRSADDQAELISATGCILTPQQKQILELGLEPRIFLRRTGPDAWTVQIELPDLTLLIQRFPGVRAVVAGQRCTIAGSKGVPLPRGALLYGRQVVPLSRWPSSEELLINFEGLDPELKYLLTMECLLRPGPRWLFKVTSDGATAAHVKTGIVQSGASYILVTRGASNLAAPTLHCSPAVVNCEGILAARLDVPEVLSSIYADELHELSLVTANEVQVAPVGLPAAQWDDSGAAEWLSTDQPIVRISVDFETQGVLLNLVGPSPAKLELSGTTAMPLLIDLGKLNSGIYNLHVVLSRPGHPNPIFGRLQFTVREPKAWTGSTPADTPFSVRVSPAAPSLEDLWEEQATVELLGPPERRVEAEIKFYSSSSPDPILERRIGSLALPSPQGCWPDLWSGVTSDKQIQNTYDASTECELILHCEELGRFVLRCSRESRPVRWIVKQENNGYFLRLELLDNQGETALTHYSFRSPADFSPMSLDPINGFRVSEGGGLFAASTGKYMASIIVPPAIHSLKWLSAEVVIPQATRSEADLSRHLSALELWSTARAVGSPFAAQRKAAAISALLDEIVRLLCGHEWWHYEQEYARATIAITDLKNFISPAKHNPIAREIISQQQQLKTLPPNGIVATLYRLTSSFLDLPVFSTERDHGVSRQEWIIEFAYRLFSTPASLRNWADEDVMAACSYLLKNPALCRVARFAALLSNAPDVNGAKVKVVDL
jgi:hypothetical protein